jgi:hypothetical protein
VAGGMGGAVGERKMKDGISKDNLGRPIMPGVQLSGNSQPIAGNQSGVDSRLLAGKLREEKNKGREKNKQAETEKGAEDEKTGEKKGGVRDRINQLKEKVNSEDKAKKKIEEAITSPAKQGTNQLLRAAWESLIPSFGMSLIYINIHVFLHLVLGDKLFCRLGDEWIPKEMKMALGEAGNKGGKAFGIFEIMGLLFLDIIAFIVLGIFFTFIVMIVDFMEANWLEKTKILVGGLTKLGWSGIKALFDLFKGL